MRLDEAEYELWALEQYHIALERQVRQLIDYTPARILRDLQDQGTITDAAAVALADQEMAELTERVYPRYFRSPFLLMLCSVCESLLLNLSDGLRELKGARLRVGEIHGDFLDRVARYFECVLDQPLDVRSAGWERIKVVFAIRHCLIHANGVVAAMRTEQAKQLQGLSRTVDGVTIVDGYVLLSADFLTESTAVIVRWLRHLLGQCERRIQAQTAEGS